MPIRWPEIFGLLVGVGICCGVIVYISANVHQRSIATSEHPQGSSQQGTPSQRSAPIASNTKTVTLRVTGSSGGQFSGYVNTLDGTHTLNGDVPADYKVEVRTDPLLADFLYATVQKNVEDDKELKLQILEDGKVLREGSTSVTHEGVVSLVWNPEEHPAESTSARESTSTQPTEKTGNIGLTQ